jgi:hypothetical protein
MPNHDRPSKAHPAGLIELTRVQPFEAEVIAARLRASGIDATVGVDSVYESVSFAEGVGVFVSADDAARARALLEDGGDGEGGGDGGDGGGGGDGW